ncbi:class I SAM-dependent methyltransferase [Aureimonas leprariae]|uniref:Class I SAM-dependent methyltransferase n=1 Tax=Plantimonas leprariae TaxID=2615207 RepID=A0A7V7PRR7_9HYPH|nr:class I SAM-dependent methyltransferase [Aureimonas leprariae]KAB0681447.1 class I SAM-dependent methyltransferase [Aureimonas leprariae]
MSGTHSTLVDRQFGAQAEAYVASAVHAAGEDLDWLAAHLATLRPVRLLDLGCGGGHVAYRAAAHAGEVTAADLSDAMLAAVQREAAARGLGNILTQQARAEALPFPDGTFDAVATRFSAHHWSDAAAGLREAARVLAPGGMLFAMDAISPGPPLLDTHLQAVEALRDPSHVRDYSAAEWLRMLAAAGFAVQEVRTCRLRMEFASWTARMRTPDAAQAAIRYLQDALPEAARRQMEVEADGSFMLPTLRIAAAKA